MVVISDMKLKTAAASFSVSVIILSSIWPPRQIQKPSQEQAFFSLLMQCVFYS